MFLSTEKLMQIPTTPFSLAVAEELLITYGSPLYVYQGEILSHTISKITSSVPYFNKKFHFATVTNGNVHLLQKFLAANWGLHANTPGDVYLGLKAGFAPENIVYTGSNLNQKEMEQLLSWGVTTFNFDSMAQLSLFSQVYQEQKEEFSAPKLGLRLGLRLNLPAITGESRIGVHPEEFLEAVKIAQSVNLKVTGVHFYRGTGTNATQAFTQVIDTVINTCQLLPDWEYLDFGGGFGYPYHHKGIAFDWEMFGEELSDKLEKVGRKIELIIEPGRAAIAACGTLLTKVVSVKWQEKKQIVGVDTTVANLSVPSVHGNYREIVTWKQGKETQENALPLLTPTLIKEGKQEETTTIIPPFQREGRGDKNPSTIIPPLTKGELGVGNFTFEGGFNYHPTDVCGNTTYSRDYLGKNCQLPALKIGDILAILDVGAYGYAMSSHFLHRLLPAEVLWENNTHRLIRKREDYNALLNNQLWE